MERNEISLHEVKVYQALRDAKDRWLTNYDASRLSGVCARTTRLHTKRFVDLGIVDIAEVFPAHRYRLSGKAGKRNSSYIRRLDSACDVFVDLVKA